MPIRGLLFSAILLTSVPVCFFRPAYGIFLWTVISFANPQAFVWEARELLPWAWLVAIPTLAGMVFFCGNWWGRIMRPKALMIMIL